MKKIVSIILCLVIVSGTANIFAQTDTKIFTDTPVNQYPGRDEAKEMITNLNFTDVPSSHWAREAIVRTGALNMVKGYQNTYNPNGTVSNEEALAFILRAMGLEDAAQQSAINMQDTAPENSPLRTLWSYGYLLQANQTGLITPAEYAYAIETPPSVEPDAFIRTAPATREQLADWIVRAMNYISPGSFANTNTQQKIYTFSDWQDISVQFVSSVELVTANNIMVGANGQFRPKGSLTRAEMAVVLKNMDSIYNNAASIEKKSGTVGGIRDDQTSRTGDASLSRNIYIRTDNGTIDIIQYAIQSTTSPQAINKDVVVYKNSQIGGLSLLEEGDKIEYLVRNTPLTALYVQVISDIEIKAVQGSLSKVEYDINRIHITDSYGKSFIYSMIEGLSGNDEKGNYVTIDKRYRYEKEIPLGSKVELTLKNNVVDEIKYIGEPVVVSEIRGIVIENNPELGYLTVVGNDGKEITKGYYEDELVVKKQQYYDQTDEIGYLSMMFPNFKYDPKDTFINEVEPGDVVFFRMSVENPEIIESISASPNYTMRYGKILQFNYDGAIPQMLLQYEDKQTAWFGVADSVFVSKSGKPINFADVKTGDWTRVLVNTAVISPGYIIESIKEINLEGPEREISNIVKGQLAGIDTIQKKLLLQNAETLAKTGWSSYAEVKQFSISSGDIEYYMDGKRISMDYADRYLKRSDGEVYVALENSYMGERVSMVTFRTGRDSLLSPDVITSSNGTGVISIQSHGGIINTDAGTIVRRYGRLVPANDVKSTDYATVALNGGKAAVIDVYDRPAAVESFNLIRGRITKVDDGKTFVMTPISQLYGNEWEYSPLERTFNIDYNTRFLDENGYMEPDKFIGYTADSVANTTSSHTVVANGTNAVVVAKSPYPNQAVRGTVYSVSSDSIGLRDTKYRNVTSGAWLDVSNKDTSSAINLPGNSIIIKNNKVVPYTEIEVGDQLRVLTNTLPSKITSAMTLDGYIIFVEK